MEGRVFTRLSRYEKPITEIPVSYLHQRPKAEIDDQKAGVKGEGAEDSSNIARAIVQAIVYRNYGPPEVLHLEDIEKPTPAADEVLIQVRAASVNPYDWHFMRGEPYPIRMMIGLRRPKFQGIGADIAGCIESVGANVTLFKPGDEVFCFGRGAFAEYACAKEPQLAAKPPNVTFEQAASIPIVGLTALQSLRDKGHLKPGQRVLINGASGGVGSFAVQLAKHFGAEVTGVCSTRNVELVRSLGADEAIDYTQRDFTQTGLPYDLILDCVGNRTLSEIRRVMRSNSVCVSAGGNSDLWMISVLTRAFESLVLSSFSGKKLVGILAKGNRADLTTIAELVASGKVAPLIDRRYPLGETRDAIRYVEQGHARGKVVIAIS